MIILHNPTKYCISCSFLEIIVYVYKQDNENATVYEEGEYAEIQQIDYPVGQTNNMVTDRLGSRLNF